MTCTTKCSLCQLLLIYVLRLIEIVLVSNTSYMLWVLLSESPSCTLQKISQTYLKAFCLVKLVLKVKLHSGVKDTVSSCCSVEAEERLSLSLLS